jgi:hypothetical protein
MTSDRARQTLMRSYGSRVVGLRAVTQQVRVQDCESYATLGGSPNGGG